MRKDGLVFMKEPFILSDNITGFCSHSINFIDEGPATDKKINLAINEFD
jgi:hypothetical protein